MPLSSQNSVRRPLQWGRIDRCVSSRWGTNVASSRRRFSFIEPGTALSLLGFAQFEVYATKSIRMRGGWCGCWSRVCAAPCFIDLTRFYAPRFGDVRGLIVLCTWVACNWWYSKQGQSLTCAIRRKSATRHCNGHVQWAARPLQRAALLILRLPETGNCRAGCIRCYVGRRQQ